MTKLCRKRKTFEAIQWDGSNTSAVVDLLQGGWKEDGIWLRQLWRRPDQDPDWRLVLFEGLEAKIGDWIMKVPGSNFGPYVVAADKFEAEYEFA